MKRWILAGVFLLFAALLGACEEEQVIETITPTFTGMEINGRDPLTEEGEIDPYFLQKDEVFEVEIFLDNPSNLPINLIRMHGRSFRAIRFEEGSTNEHIVLRINAGSIPGDSEHTLNEIEYIDDGVEALNITEDNQYGIRILKDAPQINLQSVTPNENSLNFVLNLADPDDTFIEGHLDLMDGDDVVKSMEITPGSHSFEGLLSDKEYTFKAYGDYELNDDEGVYEDVELFASAPISTLAKDSPAASIENVEASETDVTFDLDFSDPSDVLLEDGLQARIYNDEYEDTMALDLEDLSGLAFSGLLNNNEYTIEILAEYDLKDGEGVRSDVRLGTYTFTTLEREMPGVGTTLTSVSETRLVWSIDTTALNEIAVPSSVSARVFDETSGEKLAQTSLAEDQAVFDVDGFFADREIRLEIWAEYDLDDGEGIRHGKVHEETVRTDRNQKPTGSVNSMDLHQDSIDFSVSLNDPFSTAVADTFVARLYAEDEDRTLKAEKTLNGGGSYTFEDLSVYKDYAYSIEIYIDYNLRDGEGDHADHYLDSKYAKANTRAKAPVGEIEEWNAGQDSVTFAYTVLDNDETIVEDGLKAFINGEEVALENLSGTETLSELLSGKEYTLRLVAEYNLGDGVTTEELATATFTTEEKSAGTGEIVDVEKALGEFGVTVALDDKDETFVNGAILELLKDGSVLESESVEDGDTVVFENLSANTEYKLRLKTSIDLNDGEGTSDAILEETDQTTIDGLPETSIEEVEIAKESITFDAAFENVFGSVDEDSLKLVLYDRDDEIIAERSFADGYYYILSDLYSEQDYTIRIYGDVDFADGEGVQEEYLLHEETFQTLAYAFPIPEMSKPYIDAGLITVDLGSIDDEDEIYTEDDMRLVLYEIVDGEANELESIAVDLDELSDTFAFAEAYDEEKTYRVTLEASYDINHPEGLYEDKVLDSITFTGISHKE